MNEHKPLPLSQMATIDRTFFYIFLLLCLGLFIINKILRTNVISNTILGPNDISILGAALGGLLLNVVTVNVSNDQTNRILNKACYIFEVASLVVLAFMVLIFN